MKKKRGFAGILESLDEARDRRLGRKLPGWADRGIVVPTALALEQCSSSATASYKVRLALSRLGGRPEPRSPRLQAGLCILRGIPSS